MLEYWYKEKRTLTDFRRGPLGPHFDTLAAVLKARGYSRGPAIQLLSKSCQFNAFLMGQGVTRCSQLSESLLESFLDAYTQDSRTLDIGIEVSSVFLSFSHVLPSGGCEPKTVRFFENAYSHPECIRFIRMIFSQRSETQRVHSSSMSVVRSEPRMATA